MAQPPSTPTLTPAAQNYSFVTKWGTQGTGDGQFKRPEGVAVDSSGNVFVADFDNNRIQKFNASGGYLAQWGSLSTGIYQFNRPIGIAIDSSGNVYVADTYNHRILKLDAAGVYLTQWGTNGTANGQFDYPLGIAVDSSSNVYVSEYGNHRIQKFDASGTFITKWGTNGTGDGQFNTPYGIAIDSGSNVYVADTANHRIQKFDASGTFVTKWGTNGTADGQFNQPIGIATDSGGNVYVADTANNRIQRFDASGTFITKWGTNGTGDGQFNAPYYVAVDSSGNVYVSDTDNNRIQKFAPDNPEPQDTIDPSISLSSPANGSVYVQGATVEVDYICTDEEGGSGVASCTGTQADGATLDTSIPGSYTFKVDAEDNAGNTSSVTNTYTVSPFIPVTPEQYTINFETAPVNSLLYRVSTGKGIVYGGTGSAQNKTVPIIGKRALNGRILEGQSAKVLSLYGSKRLVVSSSTVNAPATTGGRLKLTFTNFAPQGVTLTSLTVSNLIKPGAYLTFYYVDGSSSRQNLGTTAAGGGQVVPLEVSNLRAVDLYAPNAYSVDDLVFEVPVQ